VFEGWGFYARAGDLLREGPDGVWVTVAIGTRARNILALLLQRPNALVSKDAIMDAAWPNVTVEPNTLPVQIAALRRILDEGRTNGSCIETVPGRGYRFVPRVGHQSEARPDPMLGPVTLGPVAGPQALGWLALWPRRGFGSGRWRPVPLRWRRCWRLRHGLAAGSSDSHRLRGCRLSCCRSRT
jgi:DNA-binding winged helix-turn-helix (wHTH) protein